MSEKDTIELGLLANNRGSVEFNKQFCQCDPEVGMSPCEYCAIDAALRAGLRLITQLEAAQKREAVMREALEGYIGAYNGDEAQDYQDAKHWHSKAVLALSYPDPSDYVSKEAVRPIVEALEGVRLNLNCWQQLVIITADGMDHLDRALTKARELGLLDK